MPLQAATPYDTSLYGIGLLDAPGGKISDAGKKAFVADVIKLLTLGNANGATLAPIASIVPIPPPGVPGTNDGKVLGPTLLPPFLEPLFWFGPDPTAPLQAPALLDPTQTPMWHSIFIDTLYQGTADLLDLPGCTPLFPIFDVSAPFGFDLPIPFALPDLAAKLGIPLIPKLLIKLAQLKIKLSLPSISLPSLPSITLPQLPPLPDLPNLVIGLILLPFKLMLKLLVPPMVSLAFDLPGLPTVVFKLAFELLLELFASFNLPVPPFPLLPKAFIASLLVYIKNIIAMTIVDIIVNLVGTGSIALGVGVLLGLVPN